MPLTQKLASFSAENPCCFVVSCLFLFISTGRRGGESWDDVGGNDTSHPTTHPAHTRTQHSRDVLHLLWLLARRAHLHKHLIYYRHTCTATQQPYFICMQVPSLTLIVLSVSFSCLHYPYDMQPSWKYIYYLHVVFSSYQRNHGSSEHFL